MPNHVTNRLEINADRETVQKVMNFLKGKTDDDNTPCYIDFNNIIPMPEGKYSINSPFHSKNVMLLLWPK